MVDLVDSGGFCGFWLWILWILVDSGGFVVDSGRFLQGS